MSFDLNIKNYQKKELEEIFGLPENYDVAVIELRETKLRENICSDTTVSDNVRNQTIQFLQQAKDNLVSTIKNEIFNKSKTMNIYNTDTSLQSSKLTSENGSQFIIERPHTAFSQSFPSEFYPGTINPLKKRSTRQYLNIDTRFRENYYSTQSTNFHLDLPMKFSNVLSLQLSTFEFSTTYYVISKLGGVFASLVFTINITPTSSGSGQMVIGFSAEPSAGATITVDFQANLQGNPDVGTPLPLKLGWNLGFRLGIYEGNNTYVSEGLVNLNGPKYFYLVVDDYNNNVNNYFYSAFTSSILNKNILARISYPNGVFSDVSENNLLLVTTPRQYFGPVDIQKFTIQLLDEFGRIVDLNNMDYSFCLTMQTVYDL